MQIIAALCLFVGRASRLSNTKMLRNMQSHANHRRYDQHIRASTLVALFDASHTSVNEAAAAQQVWVCTCHRCAVPTAGVHLESFRWCVLTSPHLLLCPECTLLLLLLT